MLVQVRTIKKSQGMSIFGEVRRHPVNEHTNTGLVKGVDKIHIKSSGRAKPAAGGGKITCGLVAPRRIQGMLRNRHDLYVGESHPDQIGHQFVR